ncbi:MAG: DNA repair protein RecO [Tistlia sp.]|uniref:DNA repair protein RecO n=1 Tax=Tistlia sp. TaxID=3057121 RepID=UPI0034A5ADA2
MLTWTDSAFVLAARPHGETSAVVQLLTLAHGRHAGLVRGGQGRRQRPVLQAGNRVSASWSARLADHLGNLTLELEAANAAAWLDDPLRLSALASAAAISELVLPEREPHPACFEAFQALVGALETEHWAEVYVQWELLLLRELGFGLDLTRCAATGSNDQLAYVSPSSGRAVSLAAAEPYRDRLLALPGFLAGRGGGGPDEVAQGLSLTGYFLERHLFHPRERSLPAARQRLTQRFPAAPGPPAAS